MSKLVLIVDDDPDIRLGLQVRLGVNGYTTIYATDGAAAMTAANAFKPDLILLDLGLPRVDGFTVLERLHSIPVIVLSGKDYEPTRERALGAGAKAYLQKPVSTDELLMTMREVLAGSSTTEKALL
jgi:two-component system, OmpR family, KDP operon response regulator KdpE